MRGKSSVFKFTDRYMGGKYIGGRYIGAHLLLFWIYDIVHYKYSIHQFRTYIFEE